MFIMVLDIDINNIYPSLVFFCSIPGYKLQAHDISSAAFRSLWSSLRFLLTQMHHQSVYVMKIPVFIRCECVTQHSSSFNLADSDLKKTAILLFSCIICCLYILFLFNRLVVSTIISAAEHINSRGCLLNFLFFFHHLFGISSATSTSCEHETKDEKA